MHLPMHAPSCHCTNYTCDALDHQKQLGIKVKSKGALLCLSRPHTHAVDHSIAHNTNASHPHLHQLRLASFIAVIQQIHQNSQLFLHLFANATIYANMGEKYITSYFKIIKVYGSENKPAFNLDINYSRRNFINYVCNKIPPIRSF